MLVVADTSALIALASCKGLELLKAIFGDVVVPQSVYKECIVPGKAQAILLQIFLEDKFKKVDNSQLLQLPANLGKGELDAMLLYKNLNAEYLLIDDVRARKVARLNQINVIGSLGVLLIAKKEGKIEKISPYLDVLENSDLYMSDYLIQHVRNLAKE